MALKKLRPKPIYFIYLRPGPDGDIIVSGIAQAKEIAEKPDLYILFQRYHPEARMFAFKAPAGTTVKQAEQAFNLLTPQERLRAYQMPPHPIVGK